MIFHIDIKNIIAPLAPKSEDGIGLECSHGDLLYISMVGQ